MNATTNREESRYSLPDISTIASDLEETNSDEFHTMLTSDNSGLTNLNLELGDSSATGKLNNDLYAASRSFLLADASEVLRVRELTWNSLSQLIWDLYS